MQQSSLRWGMILAILLVVLGASTARATSACCGEVEGFQCRESDSASELILGRAATGCWEGENGTCIGGSPLQNCLCIGGSCFARYWGDNLRGVQPVYVPVDAEGCTRAAKEGCCNRNRYLMGNCFPQSGK